MCIVAQSESGHGGRFEPCDTYIKLLSEKSRLEGLCAGLEEGNKLNLERIKNQDAQLVGLLEENEALRASLAPILRHADAHDFAPPLRLSVDDCKEIARIVDGC